MEEKEDKEELMNKEELTSPMPQGTSHSSCLEHCFLFSMLRYSFACYLLPQAAKPDPWSKGDDTWENDDDRLWEPDEQGAKCSLFQR